MKIILTGDTHGSATSVKDKIDRAVELGIPRIVILGDFGLWWGFEGVAFVDEINEYARKHNRQVFAIPGNHENYDWWNSVISTAPTAHGWAYLRTNVLLSPRVHAFSWNNKRFLVTGGAVSVDKDYRLHYERTKGKKIWSPDEQLTDDEVREAIRLGQEKKVDYFLTHDCSDSTPWGTRIKPDLDSQMHRHKIDDVLKAVKPAMHFHGHMHTKYEWDNRVGGEDWTTTYGFECNDDYYSWGVLDLDTDEFKWPDELN